MLIDGALAFSGTSEQYGDETFSVINQQGADYVILRGNQSNFPYRCYIPTDQTVVSTLRIEPDGPWAGIEITSVEEKFICIYNESTFEDIKNGNAIFNLRGLPQTIISIDKYNRIILGYNKYQCYAIAENDTTVYGNYTRLEVISDAGKQFPLVSTEPAINTEIRDGQATIHLATPITYNMLKAEVLEIDTDGDQMILEEDEDYRGTYIAILDLNHSVIGIIKEFAGTKKDILIEEFIKDNINLYYITSNIIITESLSYESDGQDYAYGYTSNEMDVLFTQDGKNALAGETYEGEMKLTYNGELAYTTKLLAKPIPENFSGIICKIYITESQQKAVIKAIGYDTEANQISNLYKDMLNVAEFGQPSPVYLHEI